jgi:tetratricopeptide (TPR) repeat protein
VLEEKFQDTVALEPEVLASHFTKAGIPERAIRYWTDAGSRSVRGSALIDAAKHFSEAIRLLTDLPTSPQRDKDELRLQLLLGPVIMAIKGYASAETFQVFSRARELAATWSQPDQQLEVLAGLFNVHYGRAEIEQAQGVARQHLAIAQETGQDEARAHCFMGQTCLVQGDFTSARTHFERTVDMFHQHREDTRRLGVYGSQYVVATAFLAGVYWALGDPQKAAQSTVRSIDYATKSEHLISIALALVTRLLTPIPGGLKGDPAEAEEALQFCTRHGLRNFEIWARFAKGAIMARRGELREGIEVMQSAINAAESMGSRLFRPVQLATIASAHARLSENDKALALVDEAIAVADRTGEGRANSALHRLRGELLIALNMRREGKLELLRALEIARAQQAVSEAERTEKTIAKLIGKVAPTPCRGWRPLAALRTFLGA